MPSVLYENGLNKIFQPEAALYFTYTRNRLCPKNQERTPFELYGGYKPSVKHLKPFGTTAYIGVPKQLRGKLDPKARRYNGRVCTKLLSNKGYRIWLPDD